MRVCCLLMTSLFGLSQLDIEMLGQVPLNQMSLSPSAGSDIWGFTDGSGREYAIMGTQNGTVFFDLSNPTQPREIGSVAGASSIWRDIKTFVYDDSADSFSAYAFITTESAQGIQIVDLSNVPESIREIPDYEGILTAHNIFIHPFSKDPFAYVLGSNLESGGVDILDISNPEGPIRVGGWHDLYTHDFFLHDKWADPEFDGKDIGIAFCGQVNISIIDFSDKTSPRTLKTITYPNITYSHSGWVSEDGRYLFAFDEIDELAGEPNTRSIVFDLIDLDQPVKVAEWHGNTRATDHNGFVRGSYVHLSNYNRGYTVIDISDPTNPFEAGNYDTFPPNDSPGFNGAWGCYPFYESGIVVISDIQSGLLVFNPGTEFSFSVSTSEEMGAVCAGGSGTPVSVSVQVSGAYNGTFHLEASELPQGIKAVITNNDFASSGTATIQFEAESTLAAGIYPIVLEVTAAGTDPQTRVFDIEVLDGADGPVALLSPANGTTSLASKAFLQWTDMGPARTYFVEVSTSLDFSTLLFSANTDQASVTVSGLPENAPIYWRVTATNPCGLSSTTPTSVIFSNGVKLLLVDDDDNLPDVQGIYTQALNDLGIPYELFDIMGGGANGPSLDRLRKHKLVVWFSGDQFQTSDGPPEAGPNEADELALIDYMAGGGGLILSSQDYVRDRGIQTEFLEALGVSDVTADFDTFSSLTGTGRLSFLGDMTFALSEGQDFPDALTVGSGSSALETPDGDVVAVSKGRSFFLAFRMEGLLNPGQQAGSDLLFSAHKATANLDIDDRRNNLYFPLNGMQLLDNTTLMLINLNDHAVLADLTAVTVDGIAVALSRPLIVANGRIDWSLEGFDINPERVLWIHVASDLPLLGAMDSRSSDRGFAIPAVDQLAPSLIVPHVAQDTEQFFTKLGMVNGTSAAINTQSENLAGVINQFELGDPYSGVFLDYETYLGTVDSSNSAFTYRTVAGETALAGAALIGYQDNTRIAGLTLKQETSQTLYFAHLAVVDNGWWTGVAITYPGTESAVLTTTAYDAFGTEVATGTVNLSPGAKILGLRDGSHAMESLIAAGVPSSAVWLKLTCDQPITGYEIFGDHSGRQFAGFQATAESRASMVFPVSGDEDHWSGLAIINPTDTPQEVTLTLFSEHGIELSSSVQTVQAFGKVLALGEQLFEAPPERGYIRVQADGSGVVGFQLYGPRDFAWLNGLNGL